MELESYALMASHEAEHWWFVGRRAVIGALLDRVALPGNAKVLEAGCGTGGNLYLLQSRGSVSAFDPHPAALDIARTRHPGIEVAGGELPDRLPFETASFDLVAALDVLEHVEDDYGAMQALIAMAKPGGHILITVPTHPFLWGSHDRRLHHKRRYSLEQFRQLHSVPGTELLYEGPFNCLLAPVAFSIRVAERLLGVNFGNQERLPAAPINRVLTALFAGESRVLRKVRLPFGLSHAALIRRSP
jgi:SAM-dependent methyltransferase